MEMLARSVAAYRVATRLASASTIRCCSACLIEVRSNFRLPPVSTMRRAKQCRYFARSLPPRKRHSRLTIVRRGCKRSRLAGIHGEAMYTAPTLRSACSYSSLRLPMCGVKGHGPLRSLGGPRGPFSHVREWPPYSVQRQRRCLPPPPCTVQGQKQRCRAASPSHPCENMALCTISF